MLLITTSSAHAAQIKSFSQVKQEFAQQAGHVSVLDRHNRLIGKVRTDFTVRHGEWVSLADISPALISAVIQSEDKRFYQHDGVDWLSIGAAAWGNVFSARARGASTLSMQVAGLVSAKLPVPGKRDVLDKLTQAKMAWDLEKQWSKTEILEAYLNLVWYRGELQGIDAASGVLFRKHPSGLNMREAVLLAVLLRSPSASVQSITVRACGLLTQMLHASQCQGLQTFIQQSLSRSSGGWAGQAYAAPHFARLAVRTASNNNSDQSPLITIKTSLDLSLQELALKSMGEHLPALAKSNVHDGAIVVLENATGNVLAYIGSSGALSTAVHVDHAQALRQAGSTLKPFLYAQAIEQQYITAASLLDNGRLNLPTASGLYIPQNYDKQFSGWVSARIALASSLNIPAVRVLTMVGANNFANKLINLGLPLDQSGDFYGYSLALGSADVSLLSLTNAYRALANQGVYSPATVFSVSDSENSGTRVLDAGAAWIAANILADNKARARTFGLDSPLSTPFWSATKTGTSKDMRDNWVIGWTSHYTIGVWVGNSTGASMHEVSGVSGAGPIWHDIAHYLHSGEQSVAPSAPTYVQQAYINFEQAIESPRTEFFLKDTAVQQVRLVNNNSNSKSTKARIINPVHGSRIAIDPDIPINNQKLLLEASGLPEEKKSYYWLLNGKVLGAGHKLWWYPQAGTHELTLIGTDQQVLDQVTIYIRGL